MRKTLLIIVASVATAYNAFGQSSTCAQSLRLAQSVYDQGRLHELPQLLESCLKSGFTDQEKVNAYKLLTLTYIYLEEPEKADQAMLNLLRTDSEFKPNDAVDPAEFVALYRTFRTNPIYRIGGKIAAVAAQPNVVTAEYVNDGDSEYALNFGLGGAVVAEIPLNNKFKKFTLQPELAFQIRSFTGTNVGADEVLKTTGRETQVIISLPVSLQYNVFQNKAKTKTVFASAGVSADYLVSSNLRIESKRGSASSPVEEKSIPVKAQRNAFNANAIISAGFKTKISKGLLVAELRYQMGLTPMLTKADQYENQTIVMDYKWVDAIYKLNAITFSVGYVLNKYNPKKLTTR